MTAVAHRVIPVLLPVLFVACTASRPTTSSPPPTASIVAADLGYQGPATEQFLASGRVVRVVEIGEGITRPRRVTLERDGIVHDAVFKWIDERRQGITQFADGTIDTDFWDTWQTEVAAYRINRLIGLNMVPAVVERPIRGQAGSLMWWADSAMSEQDRMERRLQPPDAVAWDNQIQKARLYDELIANVDRHMNNLLITSDFEIRLIDHSRAFRNLSELQKPDQLTRFSRSLLDGLQSLTFDVVKAETGRYLADARIRRMLDRRDAILALASERIAARGEAAVLYR